ncbi:hypothetical protein Mro03_57360 [Microbispora rosea subsp. rosea]|nr:hypothetical protein Mro03_57360 [Microbispora rosea subsp. rosea]
MAGALAWEPGGEQYVARLLPGGVHHRISAPAPGQPFQVGRGGAVAPYGASAPGWSGPLSPRLKVVISWPQRFGDVGMPGERRTAQYENLHTASLPPHSCTEHLLRSEPYRFHRLREFAMGRGERASL